MNTRITKTRRGVFETNSSSTHSFTLGKGDYRKRIVEWNYHICVHGGEFGWGPDRHTDFAVKASYCLTWAKTVGTAEHVERLRKVIQEGTGKDFVEFFLSSRTPDDWGYIDHQSADDRRNIGAEIFENDETLARFLFDPGSVLVIDNDNH